MSTATSSDVRTNERRRIITLEEHFTTVDIQHAVAPFLAKTPKMAELQEKLVDLGEGRLAAMDADGIDVQVLSCGGLGIDKLSPDDCTALMYSANDELAAAIRLHPSRFRGFASLNLKQPEKAARELARCVEEHNFCGALIDGMNGGGFLDDPRFTPIFEVSQALNVPLYLHPAPPPSDVFKEYFSDLREELGNQLSTAAWGWHAELGLHVLRLICAGIFDKYPRQKMIIGHMGEDLPFSLDRAASMLKDTVRDLERPIKDYFHQNFHVTSSGYFSLPPFQCALTVVGIERLLFSVDYPYSEISEGHHFLESLPLSPADKRRFTQTNAEELLGFSSRGR